MRPLVQEIATSDTPESLIERLRSESGVILLRSALFDSPQARYSFVAARPFLTFKSWGSRCEMSGSPGPQFGNPWRLLDSLMARFELLEELDLPFPLGGCFGYWGYDLKNFVEARLPRRAAQDLELPDCHVGFYESLVVFDHRLGKTWVVATGLNSEGERSPERAAEALEFWGAHLQNEEHTASTPQPIVSNQRSQNIISTFSREDFLACVGKAQAYIRAGDIYQVNVAQRFAVPYQESGWELFKSLSGISPAPFSAYLHCGEFEVVSSSPELFLRLSGSQILTRPIKGTRPRSSDPTRDAQLTYELQTSPKEMAELVMITDLLRNDLGKVCEFGSVHVPELIRLERYPQVQHLVSTVEGLLKAGTTHFHAFSSCFPGGSITGAPKIRAMEIIDELEPVARGPYTGALGYLGFNRESQLSITIRTAICKEQTAYYYAGAGIVADSNPEAEYDETIAKARGFFEALGLQSSHGVERNATPQRHS
jgi:para-aminobenzoate synthetase component 1